MYLPSTVSNHTLQTSVAVNQLRYLHSLHKTQYISSHSDTVTVLGNYLAHAHGEACTTQENMH